MSDLSIQQKRELLKRIAKGDVRPEDLASGEVSTEMWHEDESDPGYMKMFWPDKNKRISKEDYERRATLLKQKRITINIF